LEVTAFFRALTVRAFLASVSLLRVRLANFAIFVKRILNQIFDAFECTLVRHAFCNDQLKRFVVVTDLLTDIVLPYTAESFTAELFIRITLFIDNFF